VALCRHAGPVRRLSTASGTIGHVLTKSANTRRGVALSSIINAGRFGRRGIAGTASSVDAAPLLRRTAKRTVEPGPGRFPSRAGPYQPHRTGTNCQAHAAAAVVASEVDLLERVRECRLLDERDCCARTAHSWLRVAFSMGRMLNRYLDRDLAPACELDGVPSEIEQDLAHSRRITIRSTFYPTPQAGSSSLNPNAVHLIPSVADRPALRPVGLAGKQARGQDCLNGFPRTAHSAQMVGRTPWSAADAPVGLPDPARC